MMLGKRPARHDQRSLMMTHYTANSPAPPPAADWTAGRTDWGMYGNDRLGDCTAAGAAHAVQVWSTAAGKPAEPSLDQVVQFYGDTTGYDPADSSTDQGGVELDVLKWWKHNGFCGCALDAFAVLHPQSLDELRTAIWMFGGAYLGLELPRAAAGQTSLWSDISGEPGTWGGHCVYAVGYDTQFVRFISWGRVMSMTLDFYTKYTSEAYALLASDWSPSGFDHEALVTDLAAL